MDPIKTFYSKCIESMIAQCDRKARMINGKSHCAVRRADTGLAQAAFLEDHKERLVQEMIQEGLGRDSAKINSFLRKTFHDAFVEHGLRVERKESDDNGQGRSDHDGCNGEAVREWREVLHPRSRHVPPSARTPESYEPAWSDGSLLFDDDPCL